MILAASLMTSFAYWHMSNFRPKEPIYILWMSFLKPISIVLLMTPPDDGQSVYAIYKNWILFFYAVGDLTLIYDEMACLPLFLMGHLLIIGDLVMRDYWSSLIGILLTSPVIYFSQHYLSVALRREHILYRIYIVSLHLLGVVSAIHLYYGHVFFLLSDILIGVGKPSHKVLEWPLYYASVLYLVYFF